MVKRRTTKPPKGGAAPPTEDRTKVIAEGQQAWESLSKGGKDWAAWIQVGRALEIGRQQSMKRCGAKKPLGGPYNNEFAAWLKQNHFDNIDKSDRAKLLQIMGKLVEVEKFRATLTATERARINHPCSMWRRFEKSQPVAAISKRVKATAKAEQRQATKADIHAWIDLTSTLSTDEAVESLKTDRGADRENVLKRVRALLNAFEGASAELEREAA